VLANAVLWARPEKGTDFAPPAVVDMPAPQLGSRVVAEGVEV
jgi:hypothetical protein